MLGGCCTMKNFECCGNDSTFKHALKKYMKEDDLARFIANVKWGQKYLGEGEVIETEMRLPSVPGDVLCMMIPGTNYHINVKASTIMVIALLLDIKLTCGFASMLLGMKGFNTYSIVELDAWNGEKCLVINALLNKNHHLLLEDFSQYKAQCVNNHIKCKYQNNGSCSISSDDLVKLFMTLCDKNVFTQIGDHYKYNF